MRWTCDHVVFKKAVPVWSRTIGYIIWWSCQAGSRSRGGVRLADTNKAILGFQVLSYCHLVSLDDDSGDSSLSLRAAVPENAKLSEHQGFTTNAVKQLTTSGKESEIQIDISRLVEDILAQVPVIIPSSFSLSSLVLFLTVTTKGCLWGTIAMPGKRRPQTWKITMTSKTCWERKYVNTEHRSLVFPSCWKTLLMKFYSVNSRVY